MLATNNTDQTICNDANDAAPFFSVSVTKLSVMLPCTFGLYQVYWFYRQWQCVKRRERSNIQPIMRGLFPVLFAFKLGEKMDRKEEQLGLVESGRLSDLMGIWLVLTMVLSFAPSPFDFLIALVSIVPVIMVQARINRMNAAVTGEPEQNATLTGWNWLVILPGAGMLVLALIGSVAKLLGKVA